MIKIPLYIKTGSIRDAEHINTAIDAGFAASRAAFIDLVQTMCGDGHVPYRSGNLAGAIAVAALRSTDEVYVFSARDAKDSKNRSYVGFVDRIHNFWRPMKTALKSRVGRVFRDALREQGLEVATTRKGAGVIPDYLIPTVN